MKLTNQEIVDIYHTLNEIADSKEAKALLPDSGKVMYAVVKNINALKSTYKTLVEQEQGIREAFSKTANKENMQELAKQMKKDIDDLFQNTSQDVSVHQVSLEAFEILQKFLTGKGTVTLLTHMVKE